MSGKVYHGQENLIIAMDIGTTQSAVSFCHLYPESEPMIKNVTKWPSQEEARGEASVPSIIAYSEGTSIACGAAALEYEGDEDVEVAQWFKLHLNPDWMDIPDIKKTDVIDSFHQPQVESTAGFEVPPLPRNVSLKKIYVEMLKYLYSHTRDFFLKHIVDGESIWERCEQTKVIILAVPNAYEAAQHSFLSNAVIEAGILPSSRIDSSLKFVTEAEASVHFVLNYSQSSVWLREGGKFIVMDAGGSTVDTTLYLCKRTSPKLELEEGRERECVQAGGVFVDRKAKALFQDKYFGSKFDDPDSLAKMVDEFEKKSKRRFGASDTATTIKFGGNSDNDPKFSIVRGRITLTEAELASTFAPSLSKIKESCSRLLKNSDVKHLVLVGGFGQSPYLKKQLEEVYASRGINFFTIDEFGKKPAAEGAVLWHLQQTVVARVVCHTFGVSVTRDYDSSSPVHQIRQHKRIRDLDGTYRLSGCFDVLATKGEVVGDDWKVERPYFLTYNAPPENLGSFSIEILAFDGTRAPDWCKDERDNLIPEMRRVCDVTADLSALRSSLRCKYGINVQSFWEIQFRIAIWFGGTQLKAKLLWDVDGRRHEGPVKILPNSVQ